MIDQMIINYDVSHCIRKYDKFGDEMLDKINNGQNGYSLSISLPKEKANKIFNFF